MATRILLALSFLVLAGTGAASAQTPQKLTIGIYAPSVQFDTAQARLAYAQQLAKAIEQATGIKTDAQPYASLGALKKDNPNFAIIEGACLATNLNAGWTVHANANIGGSTSRQWALFSSAGDAMTALRGKTLAFVETGCNDKGFVDNAMLESEVDATFFGKRIGERDLNGAIASVASYKTAQAVFAPVNAPQTRGLTKLFDTAVIPNPAFVEINKVPAAVSSKVAGAVVGYGGGGAIQSWARGGRDAYSALNGRMQPVRKPGVFANPEPVRINPADVLVDPPTIKDPAFVSVRHHFLRSSRL